MSNPAGKCLINEIDKAYHAGVQTGTSNGYHLGFKICKERVLAILSQAIVEEDLLGSSGFTVVDIRFIDKVKKL